ncbi:ABC-type glycerol-3-phosphate transport system substrate-binding protein [Paenibacillus taihuensis]|uniref:ABC-type glycerol-3-phosphate transport system substrate-binding protein n=1 Tax=Paenibacillus taihuensis TaxID=1156355 RepID=A0A3D9SFA8_9BACL|nr:extracellular solute-binding protein [Paenibacillus taihuensis]REE94579.1 ABC-type glycerol-3-phosphate transport system substrate-binding protein [Paenibacillus taihuensis]
MERIRSLSRRRIIACLLAMMLFALPACKSGDSDGNGDTAASNAAVSAESSGAAEPITLKVQVSSTGKDFENTDVYNEIKRITGVTMDMETYDEQKFKVQLAGGDLPDIIQVPNKNIKELIEGNNIIPLDELVKTNGPNIMKPVYEKSLAYIRKFWSDNTNKLYMIPVQIGSSSFGFEQQIGFNVRWDYYKELGYPKITSMDDMINVLAEMVERHGTTSDGKKVYGVSMWNDWGSGGTWGLRSMGLITGNGLFNVNTGQLANEYTEPDKSGIWDTAYFMFKAQQRGILDPDAFTAKYNDIVAKGSEGTLLSSIATWPFYAANAELLGEGPDKGFVTIPLEWGFTNIGGTTIAGWNDRAWAISSNCKDPQRAMDLINFLVSEEGSRLIESGIEGTHWDKASGKPTMKMDTVKLAAAGGDSWKKTGIGQMANQQGFSDYTRLSDGGVVNLFNTPEVFATKVNSLNQDYDAYYGVTYPAEAYKKYADEGKVKTLDQVPQDVMNAMPPQPDDIKRIVAKVEELLVKGMPNVVLGSKTDEEYKQNQQALIRKLVEAGAETYFAWFKQAFEETKAKLVGQE